MKEDVESMRDHVFSMVGFLWLLTRTFKLTQDCYVSFALIDSTQCSVTISEAHNISFKNSMLRKWPRTKSDQVMTEVVSYKYCKVYNLTKHAVAATLRVTVRRFTVF